MKESTFSVMQDLLILAVPNPLRNENSEMPNSLHQNIPSIHGYIEDLVFYVRVRACKKRVTGNM